MVNGSRVDRYGKRILCRHAQPVCRRHLERPHADIPIPKRIRRNLTGRGIETERGSGVRRSRNQLHTIGEQIAAIRVDKGRTRHRELERLPFGKGQIGQWVGHHRCIIGVGYCDIKSIGSHKSGWISRRHPNRGHAHGIGRSLP